MPISPVWQTRTSLGGAPMPLGRPRRTGRAAAAAPGSPVAALALPEVRITPAARPPVAGEVGPADLDRGRPRPGWR